MAVRKEAVDHYYALKDLVNRKQKWDAFNFVLDNYISLHVKKLEQSTDLHDIYRAQGSIDALRKLKYLKEEVNAPS
jgi:tRNA splicing ligase